MYGTHTNVIDLYFSKPMVVAINYYTYINWYDLLCVCAQVRDYETA